MKVAGGLVQAAKIVFGSGIASVFLLASNIILARALSPVSYGDYTTAFTLSNGGMFIATFGLGQLMAQEYGRRQHFTSEFARTALFVQLITTIVACLGIVILSCLLALTSQARLLTLLLLPVLIAQATGEIASVYFQVTKQLWMSGGWMAVLNFLRLICSVLFIFTTQNIYVLPLYQAIAAVMFSAVSIYIIFRMFARYSATVEQISQPSFWDSARRVFTDASPYAVANVMFFAMSQLPIVLFAAMAGSRQAAIYGVAYLVLSSMYFVPQALMVRYLLLRYHAIVADDKRNADSLYRQGSGLAFAAGLAMAVPCYFLVPLIVTHVFGSKYDESIHLLRIMMVCVPLRFVTINLAAVMVSAVSIWRKNFADLAGGGFAIICFPLLISRYGATGGAYAAVMTEVVVLFAHYYLVERYLYERNLAAIVRRLLHLGRAGS